MLNEFWMQVVLKILLIIGIVICVAGLGFFACLMLYAFGLI